MIELYSGTPGSGKSFHATREIYYSLRAGKNVIGNYPININRVKLNFFGYWLDKLSMLIRKKPYKSRRKIGQYIYKSNNDINVDFIMDYAKENHTFKKEGETLIVLDECGIIFNPRTFNRLDRIDWIEFLSLHRHYGFNVLLISQSDRMIDRQFRAFLEYEHRHRKLNNYKLFGRILGLLSGGTLFIDVRYWYGIREKVGSEFFRYTKRIASCYDTMFVLDRTNLKEEKEEKETDNQAAPHGDTEAEQGGDPSERMDCPDTLPDSSPTS